jgi:hypothetical protein
MFLVLAPHEAAKSTNTKTEKEKDKHKKKQLLEKQNQ